MEIIPADLEGTIDFYTSVLGFSIKMRRKLESSPMAEIIFLQLNDSVLEIVAAKKPVAMSREPWQVGYRMMALEVEDMEKAVAYLKSKGVEISREPVDLTTSKRAEIKDPNGLTIELRQWL